MKNDLREPRCTDLALLYFPFSLKLLYSIHHLSASSVSTVHFNVLFTSPLSLSDLFGMPASQGELGLSQLMHVCQTQMPVLSGITQENVSLLTACHYPSPGSPYWRGSTHLVPTYRTGAPPGIISRTTAGIVSNRAMSDKLVLYNTYPPNVWGLNCYVVINLNK